MLTIDEIETEKIGMAEDTKMEEGKLSYMPKFCGEPIPGKKAACTKLKELQAEDFTKVEDSCQTVRKDDKVLMLRC